MAAEMIFPEKMDPLKEDDVKSSVKTMDDYIRYMVERIDFAFTNFVTKPNFKNSTKGIVVGTIDADYINALKIVAGSVQAQDIVGEVSVRAQNIIGDVSVRAKNIIGDVSVKAENIIGDTISGKKFTGIEGDVASIDLKYHIPDSEFDYRTQIRPASVKCTVNTTSTNYGNGGVTVYRNDKPVAQFGSSGVQCHRNTASKTITSVAGTWVKGATITVPTITGDTSGSKGYYVCKAYFRNTGNYALSNCAGAFYIGETKYDKAEVNGNTQCVWYNDSSFEVVWFGELTAGNEVSARFWTNASSAVTDTRIDIMRLG